MNKLIIILLSLFLCAGLSACEKKERTDDIYIFFTSDIHCGVDENLTLASLKALVDDTKAEHQNVLLVDCGDNIQGGTIGTLSKGSLVVSLMNDAGYDLGTYGNHEFDYGMEVLKKLDESRKFQMIASNVRYTGSKENIFENIPEYVIKELDGVKIAFLGLLTPASITDSTPTYFMEDGRFVYDFYGDGAGEALAEKVQSVVDEARKEGADYVVALSHLGSKEEPYDSISLIRRTEGIDVMLDGHSHSDIVEDRYPNKNGEDVILSSVGTKLQAAGELIIGKDGSLTTLHVEQYDRSDETIAANVAKAYGELDKILSEEIVKLGHPMTISDEEGIRMVRSRETTMADFCADAIRYEMGTDVCLVNGGGVRANIDTDVITYKDLLDVMPFQNELASCYATGQQICDSLEFAASKCEKIYSFDGNAVGENGAFLQVSGLRYTIDTSIDSPVVVGEDGMFSRFEGEERRVKNVEVLEDGNYVPIDPEKIYSVASSQYVLFLRGDGNTIMENCEKIVGNGPVDVTALIDYARYLGDLSDKYIDVEGRIIIE